MTLLTGSTPIIIDNKHNQYIIIHIFSMLELTNSFYKVMQLFVCGNLIKT